MNNHSLENPLLEFLGVTLVEWRDGYVEMRLPLNPTLLNRSGVVHGGMICTLLDAVAGYSGLYAPSGEPPRHSVTLSLTTNFLNNGVGAVLTGKGTLEKQGGRIYFPRAEVWLDDDLLVATAIGTFRYLR
ncbi:MAG: PaaI family thioesterase [Oxalobacteraceae bacterium]